jgi:hypothetical protein
MVTVKKLLCAITVFCLVTAPAFAATRIIFIGNSFTFGAHSAVRYYEPDQVRDLNPPDALGRTVGGVPALFKEFTSEAGLDYDVSLETSGGKGFDFHMTEKRSVIEGNYDVVVAQGHSTLDGPHPGDPAPLIEYARDMAALYAAINPQVKFYILDSWTHADKVPHADAPWRRTPTQLTGKDGLASYERAAKAAGAHVSGIIPLGLTWNIAIAEGVADDDPYDDAGASKMNLWAYDGYHASSFGYYLEAAMDFGKVTGKDPMMLAPKGKDHVAEDLGISPIQQQQLLRLAHDGLAAQGQTFIALR